MNTTQEINTNAALAEKYNNFDDIRPYYDHEMKAVLQRLIADPLFFKAAKYLWPEITMEQIKEKAARVDSCMGFQVEFMRDAILAIVNKSSAGLTHSGFENIKPNEQYLFVGNHRDILLDSAILQTLLVINGHNTSEITFGSNLMEQGFITDFGRINRMFTVTREATSKELYEVSKQLSSYIRYTLTEKKVSVWIAQRNGRTKDGDDITQTGLIKMFNISGGKKFIDNFKELKIVPLSISYEYEPCDIFKVQESYLSTLHTVYKKSPGEDLNSILAGITQYKGRIHLAVGKPIVDELQLLEKENSDNNRVKVLTAMVDKQIISSYKLWPTNYIAFDLLEKTNQFSANYTELEKKQFIDHVNSSIDKMDGEKDVLEQLFLKIYATPVKKV